MISFTVLFSMLSNSHFARQPDEKGSLEKITTIFGHK